MHDSSNYSGITKRDRQCSNCSRNGNDIIRRWLIATLIMAMVEEDGTVTGWASPLAGCGNEAGKIGGGRQLHDGRNGLGATAVTFPPGLRLEHNVVVVQVLPCNHASCQYFANFLCETFYCNFSLVYIFIHIGAKIITL